jgi:hypothetical protein
VPYKRRFKARSKRGKQPKPYRSWLEYDLHKGPLKHLPFEPESFPYTIEARYTPDFVDYKRNIIYEAKGRFESSKEAAKYVHFQRCNPEWEVVFIFERAQTPMPNSRKRVDGSRFTHGDWAAKNGFRFCSKTDAKRLVK